MLNRTATPCTHQDLKSSGFVSCLSGAVSCHVEREKESLHTSCHHSKSRNSCIPWPHQTDISAPSSYMDGALLSARKSRVRTEVMAEAHHVEHIVHPHCRPLSTHWLTAEVLHALVTWVMRHFEPNKFKDTENLPQTDLLGDRASQCKPRLP